MADQPIAQIVTPPIVSRKEAIARGLTRYFTGKPCKHQHVAERRTDNRHCVVCTRVQEKEPHPRQVAFALGQKTYFTGKPCKYGHVAERRTNGQCVVCCPRRQATPNSGPRRQAIADGLTRYFTGKPCKHGHVAEKWTVSRHCVACQQARMKALSQTEEYKAADRARRQTPEYKAAMQALMQTEEYKAADRARRQTPEYKAIDQARKQTEEYKAAAKALRQTEKYKAADRARRHTPEYRALIRTLSARRRALKRGAGGTYTAQDVADRLKWQHNRCAICGKARCPTCGKFLVGRGKSSKTRCQSDEHHIPIAPRKGEKQGTNEPKNIQVAHKCCNSEKGNSDPIDHMRRRGRLL